MSLPSVADPNLTKKQIAKIVNRNRAKQPLQGRTVSVFDAQTLFRLVVITGVVAMLILGLIFIPTSAYAQKAVCPRRELSLSPSRFPANLSQYMNNGYRLTPGGGEECALKNPPRRHEECIQRARVETEVTINALKQNGKMLSPFLQDKGVPSKSGYDVFVLMNPKKMENYQKALSEAEKEIVQNSRFYELSDQAILEIFKQLHRILLKDLPQSVPAGSFRNLMQVQLSYDGSPNFLQSMLNKIKKIGTREEVNTLINSFGKYRPENYEWIRNLTVKERKVWEKLIIFCPMPEEIEGLMVDFVQRLKRYHAEGMRGTRIACFVAERIRTIKPFEDGNSREELIGLNAFLKKAGVGEIVVPDARTYNAKVLEEKKTPGAFCKYVEDVLIPWTNRYREELDLET